MKKSVLLFSLFSLFLIFFEFNTQQSVFAATRCKITADCSNGDVCKVPNPTECAAIGNKDPAACYKYCEKVVGSNCKTTADCPGQLVCKIANPDQCAKYGAKDPAACKKTCQNPPPTPTPTPGYCIYDSQCPKGSRCIGYNAFECAHDGINCNGHCEPLPTATPTPTPNPPPPSPPCKTWNSGQCTSFSSAMGSILTNPSGFVVTIFAILLSISGAIAILLIIKAGYQLMTSQGKPEQVQQGRDQLIAAIVGLVFLIFSFVLLQLIGFDILHIPGFGP